MNHAVFTPLIQLQTVIKNQTGIYHFHNKKVKSVVAVVVVVL